MTGVHVMLEMLAGCGVRYLFGNPGTTELPLSDAMADERRIKYILALQEVPAVAIADGYAQASRTPGVVNLHACCGLGNGMGMIYNAYRQGTPLVITAGQQDQRMCSRSRSSGGGWSSRKALDQMGRRNSPRARLTIGDTPGSADGNDAAHRSGVSGLAA